MLISISFLSEDAFNLMINHNHDNLMKVFTFQTNRNKNSVTYRKLEKVDLLNLGKNEFEKAMYSIISAVSYINSCGFDYNNEILKNIYVTKSGRYVLGGLKKIKKDNICSDLYRIRDIIYKREEKVSKFLSNFYTNSFSYDSIHEVVVQSSK